MKPKLELVGRDELAALLGPEPDDEVEALLAQGVLIVGLEIVGGGGDDRIAVRRAEIERDDASERELRPASTRDRAVDLELQLGLSRHEVMA